MRSARRWIWGTGHIDTAQAYGNEASVGKALRESDDPLDRLGRTPTIGLTLA